MLNEIQTFGAVAGIIPSLLPRCDVIRLQQQTKHTTILHTLVCVLSNKLTVSTGTVTLTAQ